jgi:hypothetical protein
MSAPIGMNLILEKSEQIPWFTDMAATFSAMGVDPRTYDWYVSDVETNASIPALNKGDSWMTGDELASALLGQPIQFIWAVFSAFPPGVRVEVGSRPSADGNPSFWRPPDVCPQLPGACFEVVCWDSSATLLVGLSQEQADRYLRTYSNAQLLASTWSTEG